MTVNRKDAAWLRSLARGDRAVAQFYREHPHHDVGGAIVRVREKIAARYDRIAEYIDTTLPRRGRSALRPAPAERATAEPGRAEGPRDIRQ